MRLAARLQFHAALAGRDAGHRDFPALAIVGANQAASRPGTPTMSDTRDTRMPLPDNGDWAWMP